MSIKIALFLSVILQLAAAIIAITLIKRTKSNIAWWLISFGFLFMAIRRMFELFQVFESENVIVNSLTNSWLGVAVSVIMLISLSFIKRIFNIQSRIDQIKKENESRIFSAIIRTEENQKYHFSKELHDGLGPLLSAVKMSLSSIKNNRDNMDSHIVLENSEKLIDESIKTVTEISNNLSPHILMNFGLVKALNSFINKLPEYNLVSIQLYSNIKEERFEQTIETVVYRVICEFITNTLKHAHAQNIFIDVVKEKSLLSIKYLDDGDGFDIEASKEQSKGLGLTNIESRIKSVHGSCQFYSQPGQGFNANIVINLI
jgi:signal transduction histidine kinase